MRGASFNCASTHATGLICYPGVPQRTNLRQHKNILSDPFAPFFADRQPGGILETVLREYIERNQFFDEHIYYAILFPGTQ